MATWRHQYGGTETVVRRDIIPATNVIRPPTLPSRPLTLPAPNWARIRFLLTAQRKRANPTFTWALQLHSGHHSIHPSSFAQPAAQRPAAMATELRASALK